MVAYIDDFLVLSPVESEAWRCYHVTLELVQFLGFEVNVKLETPRRALTFLGVDLNTDSDGAGKCTASIGPHKREVLT